MGSNQDASWIETLVYSVCFAAIFGITRQASSYHHCQTLTAPTSPDLKTRKRPECKQTRSEHVCQNAGVMNSNYETANRKSRAKTVPSPMPTP